MSPFKVRPFAPGQSLFSITSMLVALLFLVSCVPAVAPSAPAGQTEPAALRDAQFNQWFLNPVAGRGYPEIGWAAYAGDVPDVLAGDMETIAVPLDFLGVNYYTRKICHDPIASLGYPIINRRHPVNMMARRWEVAPQAFKALLTWIHQKYGFPKLYVTENGATYDDVLWEGRVHDLARLDYIKQHVAVLPELIAAGVPVSGYFCWSLLDNFEWAAGTRDRFGLVYTDFATQQRTLKDSGHWYRRLAMANALVN